VYKTSWSFPDGEDVPGPLVLGVDKNPLINATASGYYTDEAMRVPMLHFTIGKEMALDFLNEFGNANAMWLRFEQGNEQPWIADMRGSHNAAHVFLNCINEVDNRPAPTQPYSNVKPTQPFAQPLARTAPIPPAQGLNSDTTTHDNGRI
jgi:hypothetical protein